MKVFIGIVTAKEDFKLPENLTTIGCWMEADVTDKDFKENYVMPAFESIINHMR